MPARMRGQGQVDHLTARGHVLLNLRGAAWKLGSMLVYSSESGEYVLTGQPRPPKNADPERGTVTGEALIFQRDDSVRVKAGEQDDH